VKWSCAENEFEPCPFHLSHTSPHASGRLHCIADRVMRIAPIAPEGVVHGRDLPRLVLDVRSDDGDLAADRLRSLVPEVKRNRVCVSRTSTARSSAISSLLCSGIHQSAVRSRRMLNSMASPGSSRHRSTSRT
jgi:hypothetical protein